MDSHSHEFVIAWLFASFYDTMTGPDEHDLASVLIHADFLNRSLMTRDESEHGVRDLEAVGLVQSVGQEVATTPRGLQVWQGMVDTWQEAARLGDPPSWISLASRELRDVECVAASGGWSLAAETYEVARQEQLSRMHRLSRARAMNDQ